MQTCFKASVHLRGNKKVLIMNDLTNDIIDIGQMGELIMLSNQH